jgi:uncharacterized membrane protein
MILLAALIHLPVRAIGLIGLIIVAGHNLMDVVGPAIGPALRDSPIRWFWQLVYFGGPVRLGADGPVLAVLYTIVPWIGVMAAGYAFGSIMLLAPARRRSICLWLGVTATAAFLLLRTLDGYGDPRHWRQQTRAAAQGTRAPGPAQPTVTQAPSANQNAARRPAPPPVLLFLNTSKYPASLLFLLMTLGPMLIALAWFERPRSAVTDVLALFGRVPLFYYLLHIPVIHAAACLVDLLRSGRVDPWLFRNHPMMVPPPPDGFTWSLPLLYLVTIIVIGALYLPCRWFARLRATRRSGWLSYL